MKTNEFSRNEIEKDISGELLNNKISNHSEKRKIETQEEIARSRQLPESYLNSEDSKDGNTYIDINDISTSKINTKLFYKVAKGELLRYILDFLPKSESLQLSKLKNKKINDSLIKSLREQKVEFCNELFIQEKSVLRFNFLSKGVFECNCHTLTCIDCFNSNSKCIICRKTKICSVCYEGCSKRCGSDLRYCSNCVIRIIEDLEMPELENPEMPYEKIGLCFTCRVCEKCTKMYTCGDDKTFKYCESHWKTRFIHCEKCKGYYCNDSCCRCCHECIPTRSYKGSNASYAEEDENEEGNKDQDSES